MSAWTYHVVFGDGDESRVEVGPFASSTDAVKFAAGAMGRTVNQIHDAAGDVSSEDCASNTGREVLIGYTIERYDGYQTDGNWYLNGGVAQ